MMKIKKNIITVNAVWVILIAISFLWNYTSAKEEQAKIAFQTAQAFFKQIVLTREWNADHGGVYAAVTPYNQANPYIKVPLRDIQVNNNIKLTKINPAYMTRQISEIANKRNGVQFHITSLKPIRPENQPTEWEKKALKAFNAGQKEIGEFGIDQSHVFRYMAPLMTQKTCLQCHSGQGYEEGDIRGGISVTLPFIPQIPILPLALGHMGVGVIGLSLMIGFGLKLNTAYNTIRDQATIDALTGVANRRYFAERLLQEQRRCKRNNLPLSLIICDIDDFKSYNDTYGHIEGDKCLKQVADAIKHILKRPGDFCARYGGEEFVCILPNTTQEGALHIAENLRSYVESLKVHHKGSETHDYVTMSLGLATVFSGTVSHEELIKEADKALYMAKEHGKNRVEFSEI